MTLSNPAQYISGRTVQEQMNSLIDYVDQRAAEVATDAIASDVAQVHSDAADAHTDALAAAASAAAAAGTLANAVKKTGEASQSIAGDIAVAGALSGGSVSSSGNVDGASIGSSTTPVTAGDLTAYGSVSLDDTTLQGNLSVADPSALINLSGAGSVLVPAPTSNTEAATKKYADDALDNYAPMIRSTGNQTKSGTLTLNSPPIVFSPKTAGFANTSGYFKIAKFVTNPRYYAVGLIATRGATTAIATLSGALNAGVWTASSTTLSTGDTPGRLKIGVCTIDGENYLIAHITSSTSLNIMLLGSSSGTTGTLDSLSLVTPESVTPGADYVEGGYVI